MNSRNKPGHLCSILTGRAKRCYLTDAENVTLEQHHIYHGTGLRAISDKHGFWVYLVPEMHRGTYGVHGKYGRKIDLLLKQDCQREFEKTHSREEFMQIIGKNYL